MNKNNNEIIKDECFSDDNYRSVRNMLAGLAEKVIWKHNTLCEAEEDVTIAAIANQFVQEHGDKMLLEMVEKLQEIYSCYTQRYQLIVKVNGDPFQTAIFSYLNIEECLDVAQNYVSYYDGNHDFTIIDTNLETRKVYGNGEVRAMLEQKERHYFWVASSDDGSFENFSADVFTDKEMCYNDMRNSALEKMKWNTEYREDFGDMDESEFIGYKCRFNKSIITHESYSGLYTYQIFCVEELKVRPELFFGSKFCKDLHYDKHAGEICDALMKINKRYLAD